MCHVDVLHAIDYGIWSRMTVGCHGWVCHTVWPWKTCSMLECSCSRHIGDIVPTDTHITHQAREQRSRDYSMDVSDRILATEFNQDLASAKLTFKLSQKRVARKTRRHFHSFLICVVSAKKHDAAYQPADQPWHQRVSLVSVCSAHSQSFRFSVYLKIKKNNIIDKHSSEWMLGWASSHTLHHLQLLQQWHFRWKTLFF